ncbi:MAG TPA: M28 family peptidase [Solirubrobacteraceae bacterium]|nr:M28 family peptidase [Solirubrobacteraceae bacterium]
MNTQSSLLDAHALEHVIRDVVETLAPLDRTPCSPGERQAAEWLAARLRSVRGVHAVELEDEPSWGTFPPTATGLGVLGVAAATLALRGRRASAALSAAATFAGIVDEAQNGPRIVRRLVRRRRTTVNLLARSGDAGGADGHSDPGSHAPHRAGSSSAGTLVVLAHHDAPQSGVLFHQTLQRWIYERAPQLLERGKTPLPQWWVGLAGPLSTLAAAACRRRGPAWAGLIVGAIGTALVADIWRNATVPGANDNLSGVAVLVALAELLSESPIPGARVLLVSCGAEETLQDGIRAFVLRHRHELDPRRTWFVNLDTVGSPHLIMLEGEGPVWMEDYAGPWLRDMLAAQAQRLGIALERGFRARSSTDSVIPSRAGYPTATLLSMTDWRSPANYHLPSDVPANLDYATVADATRLVYGLAAALALA